MNIERNDLDALNAELSISIAPADYAERVETAIKKYRKSMQMPGFRPGHVPVTLVKQRYGKSILAEEINQVLQDNLYKYLNDNKIEILGSPIPTGEQDEVGNWDNPGDFRFRYLIGLAPAIHVDLGKHMSYTYYKPAVDASLIDRQVKDLARRYGKMSDPETSGGEDMLMVELSELGADGQVSQNGIKASSTVSIEFIKDAATKKALIGLKKDDVVKVNPHHLAETHDDLARMLNISHEAVHSLTSEFNLKVNEIKHLEPHAIDQELFDKLFGENEVKSEEEMRDRVKEDLNIMFTRDSDFLFKRQFARSLTDSLNIQLPDGFLKKYIALTNTKPVTEEMIDHDYPMYAAQLRWELVEGKIIRQYELRVSPEDAMNYVKEVIANRYAQYGLPMDDEFLTEQAKKTLANREESKNVYDFLYEEKMIALVKERCTIEENELPYEEFVNMVQHA